MSYLNDHQVEIVKTIEGIDGKAIAQLTGFLVPAGRKFITVGFVVRPTAVSGFAVTGSCSLITGSATPIMAGVTLTGLDAVGKCYFGVTAGAIAGGSIPVVDAGDTVDFAIGTPYTASGAVTLSVDIIGYLI